MNMVSGNGHFQAVRFWYDSLLGFCHMVPRRATRPGREGGIRIWVHVNHTNRPGRSMREQGEGRVGDTQGVAAGG